MNELSLYDLAKLAGIWEEINEKADEIARLSARICDRYYWAEKAMLRRLNQHEADQ